MLLKQNGDRGLLRCKGEATAVKQTVKSEARMPVTNVDGKDEPFVPLALIFETILFATREIQSELTQPTDLKMMTEKCKLSTLRGQSS